MANLNLDGASSTLESRFWKYVDKRSCDECWNWTAKSKVDGYGVIGLGGREAKKILAHRLSWIIHNGNIPEDDSYHGIVVMHKCDNRCCVNPSHLMLGSQGDNVKDMDAKGRRKTFANNGTSHGNCRLTDDDIRYIMESNETYVALAKKFGYHWKTISNIKNGRTWKHLQG